MVFGVPLHVSVPDGWAYTCPLVSLGSQPHHTVPLNPGPVELGAKPRLSSSSLVQDPTLAGELRSRLEAFADEGDPSILDALYEQRNGSYVHELYAIVADSHPLIGIGARPLLVALVE